MRRRSADVTCGGTHGHRATSDWQAPAPTCTKALHVLHVEEGIQADRNQTDKTIAHGAFAEGKHIGIYEAVQEYRERSAALHMGLALTLNPQVGGWE